MVLHVYVTHDSTAYLTLMFTIWVYQIEFNCYLQFLSSMCVYILFIAEGFKTGLSIQDGKYKKIEMFVLSYLSSI